MFILRRVDGREWTGLTGAALKAFNIKHSGKRIKVEWGIGGIKMKWPILKSVFPMRRKKFAVIFETCCKLTNFLHRRRNNWEMEVIGDANGGAWDSDESVVLDHSSDEGESGDEAED
jgi:hypothetical protein